ncbi:hypothetical protein GCM10028777_30390 [Angustibacter speluncae]
MLPDGAGTGLPVHPGPRPEGDPGAIRAYADGMRSVADLLLTRGGLDVDGLDSAKGRELAAQARAAAGALSGARGDLRSAAAGLDTAATELAEEIRDWERRVDHYRDALAARAGGRP